MAYPGTRPAQLDLTIASAKPTSEDHSFISLCGRALYTKCLLEFDEHLDTLVKSLLLGSPRRGEVGADAVQKTTAEILAASSSVSSAYTAP